MLPSIRGRLGRLMIIWSMVWVVAGSFSVLLSVQHEADELLDDTMHASAQVMTALLGPNLDALPPGMAVEGRVARLPEERFAWQVVGADGQLLLRSPSAPETPWAPTPTAGYFDIEGWRILGEAMAHGGRMLYVSQSREERHEARLEIALGTALPALGVGLLAYLTLGAKVQHELEPLQRLSDRLDRHDPTQAGAGLGPAERAELQPVHHAIDALGQRLARQLAQERVFSAHAAHALRTPLAGMDVQLAVALREAPAELRPRLGRVREAGRRLQSVISALLLLFRGGASEPAIQAVDVAALLARWPLDRLTVTVPPGLVVRAEPDLLAAALINLLDNALRHGARHVRLSQPAPEVLRLVDDGPGVPAAQRERLRQTLQGELGRDEPRDFRQDSERGQGTGLGLQLVALVARQHGGELRLPEPAEGEGFVVELVWAAPAA